MNIHEYADREMLAMSVANDFASEINQCLLAHDFASFAVPGGTTPGPIFDMLSATDLDWSRVHILLTDERWVDETDERSNGRLLRERLLTGHAADAQFIPYHRSGKTPAEGSAEVGPTLAGELPISLLMLGMGADMHTASLFPEAQGLEAAFAHDAPLLCPIQVPGQDIARVTLPAHVLNGAMSKHLVIYGDDKREALERARHLSAQEAPIGAMLAGLDVHWAA